MGTLHEDVCTFMTVSCLILVRMRIVSDESCRENQYLHFVFNNFFQILSHLWDNVEKCGRCRQATYGDAVFELSVLDIKGYRHTFGILNTYCFSAAAMVAWVLHGVCLYVHCLSCWYLMKLVLITCRLYPCPVFVSCICEFVWDFSMLCTTDDKQKE